MKFKTPDVTAAAQVLLSDSAGNKQATMTDMDQAAAMLTSLAAERDELYKALEYARNVICASEGRDQFTLVEGNPIDAALEGGDRVTGIMARMYIGAQKKLDTEIENHRTHAARLISEKIVVMEDRDLLLDALKDCHARLNLLSESGRSKMLDSKAEGKAADALAKVCAQ